jgi:predicted DNA-binding protein with PD1-like motif
LESVTFGCYNAVDKTNQGTTFDERPELPDLSGNIAKGEDGGPIVHGFATVSRPDHTGVGGLVSEATVGPTLEIVVETMPVTIHRRHDSDLGLNLWDLAAIETAST